MMKIIGVIPARFESSRFPGKPLVDILGKTMIEHVYRQCLKSEFLDQVIVATDNARIESTVQSFGGQCVMTRKDHISGTDRVAEACQNCDPGDIIINIQGDEPTIDPGQIDQLIQQMKNERVDIGTLVRQITERKEIENQNIVKVVCAKDGRALYFSRAVIPKDRNGLNPAYLAHIGLYGFRNEVLQEVTQLPQGKLETIESLEQLRWLEHGYSIHVVKTDFKNIGIDTPEDLDQLISILESKKK